MTEKQKKDLNKVATAVTSAGGTMIQKEPSLESMQMRKGQSHNFADEMLDLGDIFTAPSRPDESTLPKLSNVDLLPPESSCPVPFELDIDPDNLVRVAPDCNRSYCEDSFSGYSGSV